MSQIYEPARQTADMALVQGINLRIVPTINANNAAELQRQIRAAVAAFLVGNPAAELVDAQFAGSGPGNVFGAMVIATLATDAGTAYFPLSSVEFDVLEAADQRTLELEMTAFFQVSKPNNFLLAWDQAIGGGGSPYMVLLASLVEE